MRQHRRVKARIEQPLRRDEQDSIGRDLMPAVAGQLGRGHGVDVGDAGSVQKLGVTFHQRAAAESLARDRLMTLTRNHRPRDGHAWSRNRRSARRCHNHITASTAFSGQQDERKHPIKMVDQGQRGEPVPADVVAEQVPAAHRPVEAGAVAGAVVLTHPTIQRSRGNQRFDLG